MVAKANPGLKSRFHIWGGRKILDFLTLHPEISGYYMEFITPGSVLSALYAGISDSQAAVKDILRYLIVRQLVVSRRMV